MSSTPSLLDGPALPRISGGFRLVRQIGRGGMGVVYEAEEISSGRTVALKVLLHELGLQGEAFERFQREARLAAAISHSRCVFVYGAHEVDGFPAIAMELVGGETLEDKIRRHEQIPIVTAVRWALDILDGLEAAHRSGVLHRDVKPSNCFVTPEGRVKIGDFGLSRSLDSDVQLTQSGQFLGSPLYASPEQIRGRTVDARSDLYSCGATLYAMLTGKPPYTGSNVGEVLARILSEPPPAPRSLRPEIPSALERVVTRAMEREPDKRWRDLASFRDALAPFADTGAAPAKVGRRIAAHLIDMGVVTIINSTLLSVALSSGAEFTKFRVDKRWEMGSIPFQIAVGSLPIVYFALSEGLWGASVGKWLFGQRVVTISTGQPAFLNAALRACAFNGPSIVIHVILFATAPNEVFYAWSVAILGVLVTAGLIAPMRRANGWRGLHELVSGTRTVQMPWPFSQKNRASPPPAAAVASLAADSDHTQQIGNMRIEGLVGKTPRGVILQAHDESLGRRVWIHAIDGGNLADEPRHSLVRPARLRWLASAHSTRGPCDVFEAPGGTALSDLAARGVRIEWAVAQRLLASLADELDATEKSGGITHCALEQVWIDRQWELRLLDEPVGSGRFEGHDPIELLAKTTRAMSCGDGSGVLGSRTELPPDLPRYAEPLMRRLLGFDAPIQTLDEVRSAFASFQGRATELSRKMRSAQLAVNTMLPALIAALVLLFTVVSGSVTRVTGGTEIALRDLRTQTVTPLREEHDAAPVPLSEDGRRAREILVVHAFQGPWGPAFESRLTAAEQETLSAARKTRKESSEADVHWADEALRPEHGAFVTARNERTDKAQRIVAAAIVGGAVLFWGLWATAFAFFLRGGLTLNLFGILVRDRRGQHASRLRCTLRSALTWLPFLIGYGGVLLLASANWMSWAVAAGIVVGAIHIVAVAHAILNPTQSLADRIAGTRLVPR